MNTPAASIQPVRIVLIMGVSGSGKTTIGENLAASLGWAFFDADGFHPRANVEKMSAGIPLTDEDRWPWLANIRAKMIEVASGSGGGLAGGGVFACSALKEIYRRRLLQGIGSARLVYLQGDFATIQRRMLERKNHFMKAGMLESQMKTLEEPAHPDVRVSVAGQPQAIIQEIREKLGL